MSDVQSHHNGTPKRAEQAAAKAVHACPASFSLILQANMQQINCNDRMKYALHRLFSVLPPISIKTSNVHIYTWLQLCDQYSKF